jgi:hypothetical protein
MSVTTLVNTAIFLMACGIAFYAVRNRFISRRATAFDMEEEESIPAIVPFEGSGWTAAAMTREAPVARSLVRSDDEVRLVGRGRGWRFRIYRCTPCSVDGRSMTEIVRVGSRGQPRDLPQYWAHTLSRAVDRLLK